MLRCLAVKDGDWYTSFCLENCISSCGLDPRDALSNLQTAIRLVTEAEEEARQQGHKVAKMRVPYYWAWRVAWWLLYAMRRVRIGTRRWMPAVLCGRM